MREREHTSIRAFMERGSCAFVRFSGISARWFAARETSRELERLGILRSLDCEQNRRQVQPPVRASCFNFQFRKIVRGCDFGPIIRVEGPMSHPLPYCGTESHLTYLQECFISSKFVSARYFRGLTADLPTIQSRGNRQPLLLMGISCSGGVGCLVARRLSLLFPGGWFKKTISVVDAAPLEAPRSQVFALVLT